MLNKGKEFICKKGCASIKCAITIVGGGNNYNPPSTCPYTSGTTALKKDFVLVEKNALNPYISKKKGIKKMRHLHVRTTETITTASFFRVNDREEEVHEHDVTDEGVWDHGV